jgi:hypothetical protein
MSVRNLLRPAQGRAGPFVVLAVLAVIALLAAGCGGSKSDSSGVASVSGDSGKASATTAPKSNPEQQLLDFARCMRDNGVNMADPTVDANGNLRLHLATGADRPSDAELQKARDACQQYLQGAAQGGSREDRTKFQDALLQYAQCMRKNGYDLPDPDFSRQGLGFDPAAVDRDDPAFKKANAVCRGYLSGLPVVVGG